MGQCLEQHRVSRFIIVERLALEMPAPQQVPTSIHWWCNVAKKSTTSMSTFLIAVRAFKAREPRTWLFFTELQCHCDHDSTALAVTKFTHHVSFFVTTAARVEVVVQFLRNCSFPTRAQKTKAHENARASRILAC